MTMPTTPVTIRIDFGPGFHVVGYDTPGYRGFAIGVDGSQVSLMHERWDFVRDQVWKIFRKYGSYQKPFSDRELIPDAGILNIGEEPNFCVFRNLNRVCLSVSFNNRNTLWFDTSVVGCPLEQAIWELETKYPYHITKA